MKIFITGLTSVPKGGMELHNLGNYVIVEPLFDYLRKTFLKADISTSIQMSDQFYQRNNIAGCHHKRFWTYGIRTGLSTFIDIFRVLAWKILRLNFLLSSPLLKEISQADLIIDFSGDVYGDNASWTAFLETNARLGVAILMNKKTAMIVGSLGPFTILWRQTIAKFILPKINLVTNREPLSTMMLNYIGIKGENIVSTACPSVLFDAAPVSLIPRNKDFERLFEDVTPTLGFIICGWNMPVGPYNRWPRDDWEFQPFIKIIKYLFEHTNYRICIMSHQNSTSHEGLLQKGNDHRIIDHLLDLLDEYYDNERIFTLEGLYDASQSKTIIGTFNLLISGRIHGAVQGMSQGIPTAVMDYGHEPKAHKLQGFSQLYGISDYIFSPTDSEEAIRIINKLIRDKKRLSLDLNERIPSVKSLALKNFKLLKDLTRCKN